MYPIWVAFHTKIDFVHNRIRHFKWCGKQKKITRRFYHIKKSSKSFKTQFRATVQQWPKMKICIRKGEEKTQIPASRKHMKSI